MAIAIPRRLSLAVLMVLPLFTAAAGAGGMFIYMSPPAERVEVPEPWVLRPTDPAIAAQVSSTYALSIARLIEDRCGKTKTSALEAASEREEQDNPVMAALARTAAAMRARTITTGHSCDYIFSEIMAAEERVDNRYPRIQLDSKRAQASTGLSH